MKRTYTIRAGAKRPVFGFFIHFFSLRAFTGCRSASSRITIRRRMKALPRKTRVCAAEDLILLSTLNVLAY